MRPTEPPDERSLYLPTDVLTRSYDGFELYAMHSPPAWRWIAATRLAEAQKRPSKRDDVSIRAALQYLRILQKGRSPDGRDPVTGAVRLRAAVGAECAEVEARILAGETFDTISAKVGIPAEVIKTYEALFFDVAGRLRAGDWIWTEAIGSLGAATPSEEQSWKIIGYGLGPQALDLLVADALGREEPRIDNRPELAEKLRFAARDHASTGLPPSREMVREYARFYRELRSRLPREEQQQLEARLAGLRLAVRRAPRMTRRRLRRISSVPAASRLRLDMLALCENMLRSMPPPPPRTA
jgi:hypothetical protein